MAEVDITDDVRKIQADELAVHTASKGHYKLVPTAVGNGVGIAQPGDGAYKLYRITRMEADRVYGVYEQTFSEMD